MSILEPLEDYRSSLTTSDCYGTTAVPVVSVGSEADVRDDHTFVGRYVQWVASKSFLCYSDLLQKS